MSRNFVYESFEDYVNYLLLIESEGDCPTCPKTSINEAEGDTTKKPWDFKFDSGKFKSSDVTEAQRKALENDFLTRVAPVLDDPTYVGRKLKISLEAASSKVPIDPNGSVAKALKAAGYTADNKGLCNARAKTVTDLIGDIIFKKYAPKGMDKTEFLKSLDAKVKFAGVAKPDIGPDYTPGKDDPKDKKYKENQYISAMLEPMGGKTPPELLISCNKENKKTGSVADASNGFIGYDKTLYLEPQAGQKVEIKFNSFTIPDAFIFSYFGENKLVPFSGSVGRYLVKGLASDADLKQRLEDGAAKGGVAGTEMKIGGKTYLVQDYKKHLNTVINKGGRLVKSIEGKLKSLVLPPISQMFPEFFDSNGKIEVYATKSPDELVATKSEEVDKTSKMLANGELEKSPLLKNTQISITVEKNITRDEVTLVAFSPVSGTAFALETKCG